MNNKSLFTIDEYVFVENANTYLIIQIHSSNLQKRFKVHYIIEDTDEYNVTEDRCRLMSIIAELNSRRRISTTTRIPLAPLNSNNSHTHLHHKLQFNLHLETPNLEDYKI